MKGLTLGRSVDLIFEVRQYLKMFADFGIERHQQIVEQPAAEQHDFHVEGDRIGFEGNCAGQAYKATDILDSDFTLTQRSLQRRPAKRLHQQVPHVQQKKAAIGAMNRAWLDMPKVCDEHAVLRNVFDAADEIGKGRVQLFDDRRRLVFPCVTDENIDFVAFERAAYATAGGTSPLVALGFHHEHGDVLDEVATNRFQMLDDSRNVDEFGLGFIDRLADRKHRRVTVELADFLSMRLLPLRDLVHDMLKILLQSLDYVLHLAPLRFRPCAKFIRGNHLPVASRRQGKADRCPQDDDALPGSLVAQSGKCFALLC